MATKSFTSEFKFNQKSSSKLADAIEKSKRVDHEIKLTVNDVVRTEKIQRIMEGFLKGK
ncbi:MULTISPECIES: hypothetical protein [Cohnella]|uniref:hypothetical protein n=1 Tax=Cohnella TaxID=329857 RepID=UPI001592B386|nr:MULTISPECIES: hypothetical protein [Cohnella]MBN2980080.1 hypothetical protein [Cohnella algarum]